jgi:chromosome transmission fidelity protein 18
MMSEREQTQRMADRLQFICQRESISQYFDKKSLLELASQSEGDIRSCLNTIQFMSSHMKSNRNLTSLMSISKDVKSDYFQSLTSILVKDKNEIQHEDDRVTQKKSSLHELYDNLAGGDMDRTDKLLQGCFENYPEIRFNSSSDLREVITALDWTGWSDMLSVKIRQQQAFTLISYQVFSLLAYHIQCSSMYKNQFHKNGILTYPKREGDARAKAHSNKNIIATVASQFSLHHHNNKLDVNSDLVPSLVTLLQPSILKHNKGGNRVNQLLTMGGPAVKNDDEKQALDKVIDLCTSYGLTFKHSSVMGKYQYLLDPPLDLVTYFPTPGSAPTPLVKNKFAAFNKEEEERQSNLNLPYNIKKLIASEVEMRKYAKPVKKQESKEDKKKSTARDMGPPSSSVTSPPNKFESASRSNKYCAKSTASSTEYMVYFQYREGNSSAVRRPAKINEFL